MSRQKTALSAHTTFDEDGNIEVHYVTTQGQSNIIPPKQPSQLPPAIQSMGSLLNTSNAIFGQNLSKPDTPSADGNKPATPPTSSPSR